jgi:hypothetical protein
MGYRGGSPLQQIGGSPDVSFITAPTLDQRRSAEGGMRQLPGRYQPNQPSPPQKDPRFSDMPVLGSMQSHDIAHWTDPITGKEARGSSTRRSYRNNLKNYFDENEGAEDYYNQQQAPIIAREKAQREREAESRRIHNMRQSGPNPAVMTNRFGGDPNIIHPPQPRGGSPFGSRNMRQAVMRQPYRPQGGIVPMLRQRQGPSRYGRYGPQ